MLHQKPFSGAMGPSHPPSLVGGKSHRLHRDDMEASNACAQETSVDGRLYSRHYGGTVYRCDCPLQEVLCGLVSVQASKRSHAQQPVWMASSLPHINGRT